MDALKGVIYTACIAGIISCIVRTAAIGSSGKRLMRVIINMIVLISVIKPVLGADLSDTISGFNSFEYESDNELDSDFNRFYIASAQLSTRNELNKLLESKGIKCRSLIISCEIDEYNVIVIKKIEAETEEDKKEEAEKTIGELFPDAELMIRAEASDADKDVS